MLYNIIYNPIVNKFYRNLIKMVAPHWKWKRKIPISGTVILKTEKGPLFVQTNPTSFATKHIFWDGLDNFEYIPIFKKLITLVNGFIDIGANTGIYSTLGCLYNTELAVLAFEPSTGPFEYLKRNIRRNSCENRVITYKIAASYVTGEAEFFEVTNNKYRFLDYNLGGVGNLGGKIAHRNMESNYVRTELIDNVLQSNHPTFSPDLIKIDTEATEDMVLAGMPETIINHRPIVICETLYNRIEDKIENFFEGKDYLFFNHLKDKNKLERVNSIKRSEDNGIRDCFFVPKEKEGLVKMFV